MDSVVAKFFANCPRDEIIADLCAVLSPFVVDETQWQTGLLQCVYRMFLSQSAVKLAPALRYRHRLLSDLIKSLEGGQLELPDVIYALHGRLATLAGAADSSGNPEHATLGHVTYQLPCVAASVVILEDRYMLSGNTTGVRSWQNLSTRAGGIYADIDILADRVPHKAGKALLDWYLCRTELIRGRRVLELGAGLGLTGLAICRNCQPEAYTLTDCHPLVLQRLSYNVQLNSDRSVSAAAQFATDSDSSALSLSCLSQLCRHSLSSLQQPAGDPSQVVPSSVQLSQGDITQTVVGGATVRVRRLDWRECSEQHVTQTYQPGGVDLVLAADISYSPELHAPFVSTVAALLRHLQPAPRVVVALTDRNEATTSQLMAALDRASLMAKLVATPANIQCSLRLDEAAKVKIFHIEPRCQQDV